MHLGRRRSAHPGRIMTRTMLLGWVWDFDFDPKTSIVERHLSRSRSTLNAGFDSNPIETVRGAGYLIRDSGCSGDYVCRSKTAVTDPYETA